MIKFNELQWINVKNMLSRSRWNLHILPGAGSLRTFYFEPELEPKSFPGAGAVTNFLGSASLTNEQATNVVYWKNLSMRGPTRHDTTRPDPTQPDTAQ